MKKVAPLCDSGFDWRATASILCFERLQQLLRSANSTKVATDDRTETCVGGNASLKRHEQARYNDDSPVNVDEGAVDKYDPSPRMSQVYRREKPLTVDPPWDRWGLWSTYPFSGRAAHFMALASATWAVHPPRRDRLRRHSRLS